MLSANSTCLAARLAYSQRVGYRLYVFAQYLYLFRLSLSRQCISAVPQRIATTFAHKFDVGSRLKTHFRKFFSPAPKQFGVHKPQIIEDRRQSEARNFETAQHIDKYQMFSCTINALQNDTKLWPTTPRNFWYNLGRILANYKWCILSNSAKNFCWSAPTSSVQFFTTAASTPSTYLLGTMAFLKFFATETVFRITVNLNF